MSLSENLYNLGALLKTNLETKGINGLTGNEGLTTLANKILDIEGNGSSSESVVARVTGNNVVFGGNYAPWLISTGNVVIHWGDGTSDIVNNPHVKISHTYDDGFNEHLITFNGIVTGIGNLCFEDCSGLTNVVIPNSIISLGREGFYGCSSLASVTIPSSVTSIGPGCFYACTSLVNYELHWKTQPVRYDALAMPVNTNTIFSIPCNTASIYIDAGYPSERLVEKTSTIENWYKYDSNTYTKSDTGKTTILSFNETENWQVEFDFMIQDDAHCRWGIYPQNNGNPQLTFDTEAGGSWGFIHGTSCSTSDSAEAWEAIDGSFTPTQWYHATIIKQNGIGTVKLDNNTIWTGSYSCSATSRNIHMTKFNSASTGYMKNIIVKDLEEVANYNLELSSTTPIIQKEDVTIINASLTHDNTPVSGERLEYIIKHGDNSLDSGYVITGNNGNAAIKYIGTGIGDVSIEVSYCSFLQETYEVIDAIYYDAMSSDTSSNYQKVNASLTFDTDHLTLTRTANGECYFEIRPTKAQYLGKTVMFKCDVNAEQDIMIRLFQYVNGAYQIASSSVSKTGTLSVSDTIDSNASVLIFRVSSNNLNMSETCEAKNFVIYPV